MLIGTVILLIMAVLAVMVVIVPAVKIAQKLFFSHKKEQPSKPQSDKKTDSNELKEASQESREENKELEFPSDEIRERYLQSGRFGMSEQSVSGEDFAFEAGSREISQDLATSSGLTLVESEFRKNASSRFRGFNIIVEDGVKATLTYAGQALAQIRREVNDTSTTYHIFTFPPKVDGNILPGDVERMLDAIERVRSVSSSPDLAYYTMREIFSETENIAGLRSDIDPQIQELESSFKVQDLLPEQDKPKASRKAGLH